MSNAIRKKRVLPSAGEMEHILGERVKELTCLYSISSEYESRKSLKSILLSITRHIKSAMQFPGETAAVICLDKEEFSHQEYARAKVRRSLKADIRVNGKRRGWVYVHYLSEMRFLPEEERMVQEVGRSLSRFLGKYELQQELRHYLGDLKSTIRAKTRELEKSEKRYEQLFDNAPDGIVISSQKGDVLKANHAFYRMLGYPEDGSVRLNFVRNRLYRNIQKIRPFIFKTLRRQGHLEGVEMTLLGKPGIPIPVIGSFNFIEFDGKRHIEAVYKDIRQRKELEQKLILQNENLEKMVQERTRDLENQKNLLIRNNQELVSLAAKLNESSINLQTLFNAITDAVVMIDADYRIKMSNQPGEASTCHQLVFGREAPCERCPAAVVFQEKKAVSQEMTKDNDIYLLQAYPIFSDAGEVEGVLEFSRLATKEKNMEMQLVQTDKLAALGQLVSGIAHEINNPNTFLRGNVVIIQEAMNDILPLLDRIASEKPDLKIARLGYDVFRKSILTLVEDMVQGTNRIKVIVDGLRKFARRDDGVLGDDVAINAVVETCLRLAANQIGRKAHVKLNLGSHLPTIKGNTQRLEQVIVNVLINASQAIEKEKGIIAIDTSFKEKEGRVELAISDNGIGMDDATKKQIFDPFFTTKRNSGGTGLGLSVAYGIIKEHRGQIKVESKVGAGTTFRIFLPVDPETKK